MSNAAGTDAASTDAAGTEEDVAAAGRAGRTGRPPTLRAVQKAETRRRLLDAATEVFIETTPTTASLDDIAGRAGVSRPTLFFHFGSRLELMAALLDHHLNDLMASAADDLPGDVRYFFETYLEFQRFPVVRLIWQLGDHLQVAWPEGSDAVYWDLVRELDKRLAAAGLPAAEARGRAVVLAPATMLVARRASFDLTTRAEEREFVTAATAMALAPPTPAPTPAKVPAQVPGRPKRTPNAASRKRASR